MKILKNILFVFIAFFLFFFVSNQVKSVYAGVACTPNGTKCSTGLACSCPEWITDPAKRLDSCTCEPTGGQADCGNTICPNCYSCNRNGTPNDFNDDFCTKNATCDSGTGGGNGADVPTPATNNPNDNNCPYTQVNCPPGGSINATSPVLSVVCVGNAYCSKPGTAQKLGDCCKYANDSDGNQYCLRSYLSTYSCCPSGTVHSCVAGANYTVVREIEEDSFNELSPSEKTAFSQKCKDSDDVFISSTSLPGGSIKVGPGVYVSTYKWNVTCRINTCSCNSNALTPTKTPTPTPPLICQKRNVCIKNSKKKKKQCVKNPRTKKTKCTLVPVCAQMKVEDYDCKPATSPTPTPPLICKQMSEYVGSVNVTSNISSIKYGDTVIFNATANNNGQSVKNMTFELLTNGVSVETKVVDAKLTSGVWNATYIHTFNSYGTHRVRVIAVTPL